MVPDQTYDKYAWTKTIVAWDFIWSNEALDKFVEVFMLSHAVLLFILIGDLASGRTAFRELFYFVSDNRLLALAYLAVWVFILVFRGSLYGTIVEDETPTEVQASKGEPGANRLLLVLVWREKGPRKVVVPLDNILWVGYSERERSFSIFFSVGVETIRVPFGVNVKSVIFDLKNLIEKKAPGMEKMVRWVDLSRPIL